MPKQELRSLAGQIIKFKERDLVLWKKRRREFEKKWTNRRFAGLLTLTSSWGCLQKHQPKKEKTHAYHR